MVGGRNFSSVGLSKFQGFLRSCTVRILRILILGLGNKGAPFGALEYGVDESSKAEMNE